MGNLCMPVCLSRGTTVRCEIDTIWVDTHLCKLCDTPVARFCTCNIAWTYIYISYGCCQGEHQRQNAINNSGSYYQVYVFDGYFHPSTSGVFKCVSWHRTVRTHRVGKIAPLCDIKPIIHHPHHRLDLAPSVKQTPTSVRHDFFAPPPPPRS